VSNPYLREAKKLFNPSFESPHLFSKIFRAKDTGSAIVEFVILAIPLLIPIIMYLNVVHESSTINSDLHNLARQSARAFISSNDESFEGVRLQNLLAIFKSKILIPHGISDTPTLQVECSATPCLTPNARVRVTATLPSKTKLLGGILRFVSTPSASYSASDVQIVDAWR
jgi:Flp pilus assembly protein TadG